MDVTRCPVCGDANSRVSVRREVLPAMQNQVYRRREDAIAARRGRLALADCPSCGFAWNSAFDPALVEYDADYDNAVPSTVMARYYDDIARYLGDKYHVDRGLVVDIGCGNGTFLKAMTRLFPESRGIGVDPALQGVTVTADGRLQLVEGAFSSALLDQPPSLFVCRHVLEHMPAPVAFLRELREALDPYRGVPIFVEVPDRGWIVRNEAFWDFCYEHCNYFSEGSLQTALRRAGFEPTATRLGFGDQYRWIEAVPAPAGSVDTAPATADPAASERLHAYAERERARIDTIRGRLRALRDGGYTVAVWGMATKGVLLTLLADPDATIISATVDVNTGKQGCFTPISGRTIEPPEALQRYRGQPLAIVVMNTNYASEIRECCRSLGVDAMFLSADAEVAA